LLLLTATTVLSFSDDEITDLPGIPENINFKQFSGYLDAGRGRHLFYWFVQSENDPSNDPVMLWLNGGPGCSSLGGNLMELGPFRINNKNPGQLEMNQHRWNLKANVLFLEAPAGVGYSYQDNGQLNTDDNDTAQGNLNALKSFFNKFPQFKQNPFFIAGESYAGIFIPTLAVKIAKERGQANAINLKGYAIGNGYMETRMLHDSMPVYGYSHGLLSQTSFNNLVRACCGGRTGPVGCKFHENQGPMCQLAYGYVNYEMFAAQFNPYNIYGTCPTADDDGINATSINYSNERTPSRLDFDLQLVMGDKNYQKIYANFNDTDGITYASNPTIPCLDDRHIVTYLGDPRVRRALHVHDKAGQWAVCSEKARSFYRKTYQTVKPEILFLAKQGIKGMIFNGDIDFVCNLLSNEWFVEDLQLRLSEPPRFWLHRNQVGGKVRMYENLMYLTVRGAGHMVPEDKPSEALQMLETFFDWVLPKWS